MQNKPNFEELAGGWNTHHSTIPSFQRSSPMPFVRNKPNSAWRESKGKCFMAKGLRGIRPAKDLGKTKPILGGAGWAGAREARAGDLVKTKPIGPREPAGRDTPLSSIPLFHHSDPMPFARNKANFRSSGGARPYKRRTPGCSDPRKRGTPNGCGRQCRTIMHPRLKQLLLWPGQVSKLTS